MKTRAVITLLACIVAFNANSEELNCEKRPNTKEAIICLQERIKILQEEKRLPFTLGVPVGSIVAWHKSIAGTPGLPDGWVECNGQTIFDNKSPYNGQTLPDLNKTGRFLRGASVSGNMQNDETKSHAHAEGNLSGSTSNNGNHNHAMASVNGRGYNDKNPPSGISPGGTGYSAAISFPSISNAGAHTHSVSISGSSAQTGGSETRPINMSVVWVMKIK